MALKTILSALVAFSVVAGIAGTAPVASVHTAEWQAARIVVRLGEETVSLRRTSVEAKNDGWTWRGESDRTGEPAIAMWWKDGRFGGLFTYRGDMFTLKSVSTVDAELHAIAERNPQGTPPRHTAPQARDHIGDATLKTEHGPTEVSGARASAMVPQDASTLSLAERRAMATKDVTIDVMILYTSKVRSHYLDVETDVVAHSIAEANESFANSGIANVKLRLVHTQEIGYDEADGEHFNHLYRMVDGLGAFAGVRALRNQKHADVVVLIVDDASGCGLTTRVSADAEEAFAVVHHACAALTYSVPHEIGHIIGAGHDAALDQGAAPFSYGHGFVNGTKWRDIMSYKSSCNGCRRLALWSNPTITVDGEPAGTAQADNARVILEQAERVAKFR